jgi:LAO/AO transport system kinase
MCSALRNVGLDEIWSRLVEYREKLTASGELQEKRRNQRVHFMWSMLQDRLLSDLKAHPSVVAELPRIQSDLYEGRLTVTLAVEEILTLSRT